MHLTGIPSAVPTPAPSFSPSLPPTAIPTESGTDSPTQTPSNLPTSVPTRSPTHRSDVLAGSERLVLHLDMRFDRNVTVVESFNCTSNGTANSTDGSGAQSNNGTNCTAPIAAKYEAAQIFRDQTCWSAGARWLGTRPAAEDCMEAVRSNSDCNHEYFAYVFGGDRNCGCLEAARDCSDERGRQEMPTVGVYQIRRVEETKPQITVRVSAVDGFDQTLKRGLATSIARSAVISLERIVVLDVSDAREDQPGVGAEVELLVLNSNAPQWAHERSASEVVELIQALLLETSAPTRSPTPTPTVAPTRPPTTPTPTELPTLNYTLLQEQVCGSDM